jgi:hypothetical protein
MPVNRFDAMSGLERAWHTIADFIPRFLGFTLILVVGYFVAMSVGKMVTKLLRRSRFDNILERGGLQKALQNTKFDASSIVGKVAFYTVFLFALQMAFGFFEPNAISDLLKQTIAYLPHVFVAIAIIVVSAFIASGVRDIVKATLGGLSYGRTVATVASAAVMIIGVFAALDQLGVAPMIVIGLFYAMLAIITGSAIIAIGGGGIQPMRAQWEKALNKVSEEAPRVREEMERSRVEAPVEGPYTA